jgi:ParB family chromosome partitioning protein
MQLGQTEIPAIIIEAEQSDCLVMSLVENCARRQHRAIDLLQDIGTAPRSRLQRPRNRSKNRRHVEYIHMIGTLLETGEERLLTAVEAGILPLNMAIEIAKSSDEDVQQALTQAYTEKKLRGKKLVTVRKIIEQRRRRGKQMHDSRFGRRDGAKRPLTSESIMRVYRQEADRQKLLVKKAEVTQSRLLFIVEAIRELRCDDNFSNLLKAERLDTMPAFLEQRIADGLVA